MNRLISRVSIVLLVNVFTISAGTTRESIGQDNNPLQVLQASSQPVKYDVLDLSKTSLRFADEDTSLYLGSYQMGKQWQSFLQSDFAKQLLNSQVAKKWTAVFNSKWQQRDGDIGKLRVQLDNPNLNSFIRLIGDMLHEDAFVYCDSETPNTLLEINEFSREFQSVVAGAAGDIEQITEYLRSLDKSRFDQIQVPTVVFGGKVSNKDLATEQISMLGGFLSVILGQSPPPFDAIGQGYKFVDDATGTRLSLTLKPSMVPWEAFAQFEEISNELKRLSEGRAFTITIGMLQDYLLVSISESPEDILALLDVSDSLLESDNLSLVREKSKLSVLGVSYLSDDWAEANFDMNLRDYFSRNVGGLLVALNDQMISGLEFSDDEEETEKLQKTVSILQSLPDDLSWLDEQIGQHVPKFRGGTAVAVATADGAEGWNQYRTASVIWDSQASLPVLDQLGGKPLAFIAGRRQYHPEYFETCRRIVQKVHTYLEKVVDAGIVEDEEDAEQLDLLMEKGWPLLAKFADIIEQDIIPSTKDGQFAVALTESNVKEKKFANDMPESKVALPLPEFAKIIGTNDSAKLIDGFEKLYGLGDEVVTVIREADPNAIDESFNIERPESRSNPAGQNYFYPVPKQIGIPDSILPQALFTKEFAYFSYSNPQVAALVKKTPLSVTSSFIKEHKSIAASVYLDAGRIFLQFRPWLVYAMEQEKKEVIVPARDEYPELTKSDVLEIYDAFTKSGEFISVETGSDAGGVAHWRSYR